MQQRTFLGHPIGLYILFFTEMWERFSYYGMRALLVLYLTNHMKWDPNQVSTTYKFYTTLVYVTPILGGFLADRYLGNAWAVIIGAVLMAFGHFFMAFESTEILYTALILLILGNGFFKPNMSTQVGRLYPANDSRRDAAYTIFYMGINLGAFLSPLVCGWLRENTVGGYHSGFTMAGIGMVLGLLTYVLGKPLVKEIPAEEKAATASGEGQPATETEAQSIPSLLGSVEHSIPLVFGLGAVLMLLSAPAAMFLLKMSWGDAAILGITGLCLGVMAYVSSQIQNAVRDRVVTILILGVFTVIFWGAFEQGGNTQNLWADQSTNRYLTEPSKHADEGQSEAAPESTDKKVEEPGARPTGLAWFTQMFQLKPRPVVKDESWGQWFAKSLNPVPTEWFQSINALAIFVLAPLFAWMWVALDRRRLQPSIPMKMMIGLVFMSLSMAAMFAAALSEHHPSEVVLKGEFPKSFAVAAPSGSASLERVTLGRKSDGQPFHAGRLFYDVPTGKLVVYGVLPDVERDRVIGTTAPADFQKLVKQLAERSATIEEANRKSKTKTVIRHKLVDEPLGFDPRLNGASASVIAFDPVSSQLILRGKLSERETLALLVSAGDPEFRSAVRELSRTSQRFRVSPWWLFWSFILATLGELCLSPVGLSMVSKLAPARFATMIMGVWLFISALGNFVAGTLGEYWGRIPPIQFFLLITVAEAVFAVILLLLVRLVTRMMHGVN